MKKKRAVKRTPSVAASKPHQSKKPTRRVQQKRTNASTSQRRITQAASERSRTVVAREGRFPIVGIGASAGGLEALEQLLKAMPSDTGMGFVIVTHQHPGHTSLMPELLSRDTDLSVIEAADGMKVEPNHVYVCPPGGQLDILNGRLHHMAIGKSEPPHLPIDHFFRSLAQDLKERAICIVLSGTGTDGTLGMKAVKGESGMAMVQQVESAKYAGMPSSAIATGLADYVLRPDAMPARLVAYAGGPYLAPSRREEVRELPPEPMQKMFVLLRSRTGHDFSAYKENTIRRRIERRMNLHQIRNSSQYVRYLQDNPHEVDMLFRELLISVTSFFRDPQAFEELSQKAVPDLLASRPDNYVLRAWVPGCATGEEVYSLAMVMREAVDNARRGIEVQVFGTDLDTEAIDAARSGQYLDGIAVDVAPKRLERFFIRGDGGFRIRKDIRELAVFAVQNVIKDPPFTKLDIISCRNLLIYLNGDLQKKLLPMFHYALKPGGLLFLGPSESIGPFGDLFEVLDKRWKIFRRTESPLAIHKVFEMPLEATRLPGEARAPVAPRASKEPSVIRLVERLLLGRFAPASVVVNERGDVVYIYGRTGAYLEPAAGQPRLNIHDMAREGLRSELAVALRQAARQNEEVTHEAVRVRTNGDFLQVSLTVVRIREPEVLRGLYLVTFRPRPAPMRLKQPKGRVARDRETTRVGMLERELQNIRESLQTTIEELETSNEELKSTNEELQSTNEELQSSNEELETSKEEMQSLNEELTTVNAELQSKVEELSRANDDMQNLLNSTKIATIFLDRDLCIKRYTEQARRLVSFIHTDVGRPLADLVSSLNYDRLVADSREVMRTLVFKQAEVQTGDGEWFLMRIMPYRTADNVIDGLVLTFVDINPVKKVEQELATAKDRLEADLQAMVRLQEIGTRFVREGDLRGILEEVLDAGIYMAKADKGIIKLVDPASGALKVKTQRGFDPSWIKDWDRLDDRKISWSKALKKGEPVIVEDLNQSDLFAGSAVRKVLLKAEVQAAQATPLLSRTGRLLGTITTHFKVPHRPGDRTLRLLDLLARQTADILERAEAGLASSASKEAES